MNSIKVVGIVTIIVFGLMYFIVNEKLRNEILKVFNCKFFIIKVKDLFVILIMFIAIMYSLLVWLDTKQLLSFISKKYVKKQEQSYYNSRKIIDSQNKRYKELYSIETNIEKCKDPYIPNDFKYVLGEWNSGYVIEDENGNQFVWVPCTNKENNEGIPLLKKKVFYDNNVIFYNCYEQDDFEEFITSSLENGGFYISRFEIGNENDIPVSKKDMNIWTNISWDDAKKLSENMYSNINSKLINGYAYDTAISFIFDEIDKETIPPTTKISGTKSYKNIYDITDDLQEWTSEMRNETNLFRGTMFTNKLVEETIVVDRFSCSEKLDNLGFRTIIYK